MNNRRSFFRKAVAGLAIMLATPFTEKTRASLKFSGALVHHVFFWLKEPDNQAARKQLEKALNELVTIETIKLSHIGRPASTEQREVVDHSYSYSLLTVFDSQAGQDAYQVHPVHVKFVEENSHLWEKVVVYDSIDL